MHGTERRYVSILLAMICLTTLRTTAGQSGGWSRYLELGLPHMAESPKVDGAVDMAEWVTAARLPQMIGGVSGIIDEDITEVYAAHSDTELLLAWRVRRPRGLPLVMTATTPGYHAGRAVYLDDCIEVFIQLPGAKTMVSFAGNAAGAYSDGCFTGSLTVFTESWPWRYAARQTDDGWEAELAITFEALGYKGSQGGDDLWGLDIWRNNKSPNAALAQVAYSMRKPNRLARVRLLKTAPAFRQLQTGNIGNQTLGMLAEVVAFGANDNEVDFSYGIYRRRDSSAEENLLATFDAGLDKATDDASSDVAAFIGRSRAYAEAKMLADLIALHEPVKESSQKVKLAANGRLPLSMVASDIGSGDYLLAYRVADAAAGVLAAGIAPITHWGNMQLKVTPYFIQEQLALQLKIHSPAMVEETQAVRFELTQAGKVLATTTAAADGANCSVVLPASNLVTGAYIVKATALDNTGAPLGSSEEALFRPEPPDWLTRQPGRKSFVPQPWHPVREKEGVIAVWGREYHFGSGFLPDSIISGNGELLTGPPRLHLVTDGTEHEWSGVVKVVARHDEKVELEWQGRAGSLVANARMSVEFDGFYTLDLELETGGITINRFWVEFPMVASVAQQYGLNWTMQGMPRESTIPDAGQLKNPVAFGFKPGVWLGATERGLQWIAESNEHWRSQKGMAIELIPGAEETLLRLRVVDRPFVTPQRINYRWGLMASPVKPYDPPVNRQHFYAQLHIPTELYRGEEQGIEKFQHDLNCAAALGANWINTYYWINRLPAPDGQDTFGEVFLEKPEHIEAHRRAVKMIHAMGMRHSVYTGWNAMHPKMSDYPYYGEAMKHTPSRFTYGAYKPCMRGGYVEYMAGGVAWLAENLGVEGLYLDSTAGLKPCNDPIHGCGYLHAETGQRVETYNVWAHRELFKRLYKILHGEVIENGLIYSHTGGAPMLAIDSFVDIRHGAEGVNLEHYLDLPGFRSRYYGRTFGIPLELTWVYQAPRNLVWGVGLLHDTPIKMYSAMFRRPNRTNHYNAKGGIDWRTWLPYHWFDWTSPYKWYPYYTNSQILRRSPEKIEASFYCNERGQMIFNAVNLSDEAQLGEFSLDIATLQLPEKLYARDVVTDETFEIDKGIFKLEFAGYRPRLLMIATEPVAAPALDASDW